MGWETEWALITSSESAALELGEWGFSLGYKWLIPQHLDFKGWVRQGTRLL